MSIQYDSELWYGSSEIYDSFDHEYQVGTEDLKEIWEKFKKMIQNLLKRIGEFFDNLFKSVEKEKYVTYVSMMDNNINSMNSQMNSMTETKEIKIDASKLPKLEVLQSWNDLESIFQFWNAEEFLAFDNIKPTIDELILNVGKLKTKEYNPNSKSLILQMGSNMQQPLPHLIASMKKLEKYGYKEENTKLITNFESVPRGEKDTSEQLSSNTINGNTYYSGALKLFDQYKKIKSSDDKFQKSSQELGKIIPDILKSLQSSLDSLGSNTEDYDKEQLSQAKKDIKSAIAFCQFKMKMISMNRQFNRMIQKTITVIVNQYKKGLNPKENKDEQNKEKPAKEQLGRIFKMDTTVNTSPVILDYQFELLDEQISDYLELSELPYRQKYKAQEGFTLGCLTGYSRLHHEHPEDWQRGLEEAGDGLLKRIGNFFVSIFKAIGAFFNWLFGGSNSKNKAFDFETSKKLLSWFGELVKEDVNLPLTATIDMSECLSVEELKKLSTTMLTNFIPLIQTFPSKEEVTEIDGLVKNLFDQSIWEEFKTKSKDIKKLKEIIDTGADTFWKSSDVQAFKPFIGDSEKLEKGSDQYKYTIDVDKIPAGVSIGIPKDHGYLDLCKIEIPRFDEAFTSVKSLNRSINSVKSKIRELNKEQFKSKENLLAFMAEAKVTLRGLKLQMFYFMFYKKILIFYKTETNKIMTKIKFGVLEEIKTQKNK